MQFFFYENSSLLPLQAVLTNLNLFVKKCNDKLEFFRAGNFFKRL